MSETNWALYALIAITFMAIGANMSEAGINLETRDLIMNAFGSQGYINNSWFSGDTRFAGNVNGSGYQLSDTVIENATLLDAVVATGASSSFDMGSNTLKGLNTMLGATGQNPAIRPATSGVFQIQNSTSAEQMVIGDGLGTQVAIRMAGHLIMNSNNSWDIGSPGAKARAIYAVTNGIGDLREDYLADPAFSYPIGIVVALSPGANEIKPVQNKADRIIGVVAQGPRTSVDSVSLPNGSNGFVTTNIATHEIIIYGKTPDAIKVKVKGTIAKGDYLVASDTEGVVTSMYNTAHPLFPSVLPASTNVNTYNQYAKLLPNLGIAMEAYNSASVGTIIVLVGK